MVSYMYYINNFFIYSILGYLLELIINKINGKKVGSGMLYGPWTPVYGLGSILVLIFSKFIFNLLNFNKFIEIIIVVIIMMIILTFLEWIGGVLIEKIFHVVFWDYTEFKFNIGKYIALEVSFIWGIGSLLIIYVIQPIIDKFIYLIPSFITYILIILFLIDLIVVFSKNKVHK